MVTGIAPTSTIYDGGEGAYGGGGLIKMVMEVVVVKEVWIVVRLEDMEVW